MIKILMAGLALALAVPLCAAETVPVTKTTPTQAMATALAEQTARAEKAERALAIRDAVADEAGQLRTDAYSQFQLLMAAFGFLITGIVIYFSFQSQRVAGAEAAKAAREEMVSVKKDIESLRDAAIEAKRQADEATAMANEAAARAMEAQDEAVAARGKAEQAAAGAVEKAGEAARIIDSIKANASDKEAVTLTPDQRDTIVTAAEESAGTPETQWTVDQFKTAIGKAMYVDKDWTEVLRLTDMMEVVHRADEGALLYALNRRGDALRELERHEEAQRAYEAVMTVTTDKPTKRRQRDYIWAAHCLAFCLARSGRAAEAEALLAAVLPLSDKVDGPTHPNTLVTRSSHARVILNQGRAAEAEALFAALLPLREKVHGPAHSGTLITRHDHACAIFDQGRAAEAEALFAAQIPLCEMVDGREHSGTYVTRYHWARAKLECGDIDGAAATLAGIPDPVLNQDWSPSNEAGLAFVRGQLADAQGDRAAAELRLAAAAAIYAEIYPAEHADRVRFDAYMAKRGAGPSDA